MTSKALTLSDIFGPKAYQEMHESRWYLIGVIDNLYTHGLETSSSNIKNTLLKNINGNPEWAKRFHLGFNNSIDDVIGQMVYGRVLEYIDERTKLSYKLTENGRECLEHFKKEIKIFK